MTNHIRNIERAHLHTYVPSLFIITMVASLILDSFFPNPMYSVAWAMNAGLALVLLGSILIYWAQISSREIRKKVKNLENEVNFFVGPYAYVRHPGYTGMVLVGVGMSLIINSTVILLSTIIFYLIARAVATKEEAHLLRQDSHVKHHYSEYTKKVKRYF